jgi:hypothetical protein
MNFSFFSLGYALQEQRSFKQLGNNIDEPKKRKIF